MQRKMHCLRLRWGSVKEEGFPRPSSSALLAGIVCQKPSVKQTSIRSLLHYTRLGEHMQLIVLCGEQAATVLSPSTTKGQNIRRETEDDQEDSFLEGWFVNEDLTTRMGGSQVDDEYPAGMFFGLI